MEALAAGLTRNSALTVLDLSNNRISDKGGVVLCSVLRNHATIAQIVLKDNELREQTGQILADMTRTRRRIVKVSVENNPMSHKYVMDIKNNVAANQKSKGFSRTPGLLRELRELEMQDTDSAPVAVPSSALRTLCVLFSAWAWRGGSGEALVEAIVGEVQRLKAEEAALLQQIEVHKEKFSKYQQAEEARTQAVFKEAEVVQQHKQQVVAEYVGVLQQLKDADFSLHAEMKTLEEKINSAHLELVRKEKECERHSDNSLKTYSASCRSHFMERLSRLTEELRAQKQAKKQLETTVLGLRKQVEILKFEIEQITATHAEEDAEEEAKERKTTKGTAHTATRKKKRRKKKEEGKDGEP